MAVDRVSTGVSAAAAEEASASASSESTAGPGSSPETLVSEDLQDTYVLLLNAGAASGVSWVKDVPPACYLETTVTVAAQLRSGELPPLSLSQPLTLPEGSTLRWEVPGGERPGEQDQLRELSRLGPSTLRVTTTSMAAQEDDPFAGMEPVGNARGAGMPALERSMGRTADLDLSREGALLAYQHFVATGEVPLADEAAGVLRSGRVAVFTQQRTPGAELGFLRQFRRLDAEHVMNVQWSAEYDDGSVEVRSSARFTGRLVLWHVKIDSSGQQTHGDLSVVFSHLTPATVAALARGLRGEAEGLEGRWHAELLLADQEVMLWRDLARVRVCERNGLAPGQFDREARTSAMELWEGDVGLQTLALARTPDEVGDMLVRLGGTAEAAAQALAQLMLSLGSPLEGTLRIAPAQSA
jgi:hypothetical protein